MPQVYGKVNRAKPTKIADGSQLEKRLDSYGEQFVVPLTSGLYGIANEGSYFRAINPTPGTGIAQTVQTTFSATNGVLTLYNGDAADGKRIFLDYIRLIPTVVGTSTTRTEALIAIDNIQRWSSGGTQITALNNVNMADGTGSIATLRVGALTLAAESGSVRRISRFQIATAIMVAFEEYIINFGAQDGGSGAIASASGLRKAVPVGPIILGDGDTMTLHIWNTGNVTTAPSYEVEVGWWEK